MEIKENQKTIAMYGDNQDNRFGYSADLDNSKLRKMYGGGGNDTFPLRTYWQQQIIDFNDSHDKIILDKLTERYKVEKSGDGIYLHNNEVNSSAKVWGSKGGYDKMRDSLHRFYNGQKQDEFQ